MSRLGSRARLGVLAIAVTLTLAACTSSAAESGPGSGHDHASVVPSQLQDAPDTQYDGFGLIPPKPRPSFTLRDTTGTTVDFGTLTAGRPTLLFFGYTHCVDECPTTFADINLALNNVAPAVRDKTLVVFVTTDPKRDTGPVIRTWLDQFAAGLQTSQFIGLNGSQAQIDAAQAASGVLIAEDGGETHSTVVMLYGPDDYAHVQFVLSDNERQQMEHDLPIVAAMPATK